MSKPDAIPSLRQRQERAWDYVFDTMHAELSALDDADALVSNGAKSNMQRILVVVPFAQLMPIAQKQWLRWSQRAQAADQRVGLPPQFETTYNWVNGLRLSALRTDGGVAGNADYRGDAAFDSVNALSLLVQAGLEKEEARRVLPDFLQACAELLPAVQAVLPEDRADWAAALQPELVKGMEHQHLRYERLLASVALVWLSSSVLVTDALFDVASLQMWDAVVQVQGIQPDPLVQAVADFARDCLPQQRWLTLAFDYLHVDDAAEDATAQEQTPARHTVPRIFEAAHAGQEADAAAAAVLRLVQSGTHPVALVAQDRALTRRVRTVLELRGLEVRDESGWKLSTTPAAAAIVALLRAVPYQAETVQVLDYMKAVLRMREHALIASAVTDSDAAEKEKERQAIDALQHGVQWIENLAHKEQHVQWMRCKADLTRGGQEQESTSPPPDAVAAWLDSIDAVQQAFAQVACVADGVQALRTALRVQRLDDALGDLPAGEQCLAALYAQPWQDGALDDVAQQPLHGYGVSSVQMFADWVQQQLEQTNYVPAYTVRSQVTVLPLSQVLGRDFAALVQPGADADNLTLTMPHHQQFWTPRQRELLGLPSAEQHAQQVQQAFAYALQVPHVDVLYSTQKSGEDTVASPLVQQLLIQEKTAESPENMLRDMPCVFPAQTLLDETTVPAQTQAMQPSSAAGLPLQSLSASAYQSLRQCPYQFYAGYLLKLRAVQEIDERQDRRLYGEWLHKVLAAFHQQRAASVAEHALGNREQDAELLDACAQRYMPKEARFLPHKLVWNALREAYLDWQYENERRGWRFGGSEKAVEVEFEGVRLYGRLDRIDKMAGVGSSVTVSDDAVSPETTWLLDYKTGSETQGRQAVKEPLEKIQMTFYALLVALARGIEAGTVRASYVHVVKQKVWEYSLKEIADIVAELRTGLAHDIAHVRGGGAMPALGSGAVCGYCAYEGLCRKAHWGDASIAVSSAVADQERA